MPIISLCPFSWVQFTCQLKKNNSFQNNHCYISKQSLLHFKTITVTFNSYLFVLLVVSKNNILLGNVIEEFGKTNIIIRAFIEAKYCEGTPTTLKFTHESWDYIHKEEAKRYPEYKILGWIHTHPDFGIFLSEYDKFIHENFFNGENQVAYVVDPIQNIEGFYFWINGKIERCKGFFLFDKMCGSTFGDNG